MNTPELLSNFETCDRKGYFSRSWEPQKLNSTRMMAEAIRIALGAAGEQDWGTLAGSAMLQLAQDRGLETDTHNGIYDAVVHHACIADLVVTCIRKPGDPPWLTPEPVENWTSGCYVSASGDTLRRVVLVTHWSDERHASECRSWYTLGEQAMYELPMQMIVIVIGQQRDGKRSSSPWASGFLHPANSDLRFRKRRMGSKLPFNVFSDRWTKIYREDHDEISRKKWLDAMLRDGVMQDVCFREDIPIPPTPHLLRVQRMAQEKLSRIYAMRRTPEANLSGCDWPVPCPFRKCCYTLPEVEPEEKYGFIRITHHTPDPTASRPTSQKTSADPCLPAQSVPASPPV
jgi:hypothetical protein